ncbi:hypothetical protein [Paraburkholderia sp. J10-1]|uniref:hypothetical protein n=1 Tax=Paraburkholderia sp. J10-1 TaxID=2805430 RepID=UPI002AB7E0D4|nr:hypothetical protein [Paraburkholderia sp. J10-1]
MATPFLVVVMACLRKVRASPRSCSRCMLLESPPEATGAGFDAGSRFVHAATIFPTGMRRNFSAPL